MKTIFRGPRTRLSLLKNGDLIFENARYFLTFDKVGGFGIRRLRIKTGSNARLDRFDRPGAGINPACMYFDHIVLDLKDVGRFMQSFYGMPNKSARFRVLRRGKMPQIVIQGSLIKLPQGHPGDVQFTKTISFHQNHYEARIKLQRSKPARVISLSIWHDLNDDWSSFMANSFGDYLSLTEGVGECPHSDRSFRSFKDMDRGYGIWMAAGGLKEQILVAVDGAVAERFPRGGFKFFDGPDDKVAGKGASHSCINLDFYWKEGRGSALKVGPESPITFSYKVFFIGRQVEFR